MSEVWSHLDPRCVRCTGQHHFSQCTLDKKITPQCVNCGEDHTANFKGCTYYQNIKQKPLNQRNKIQKSISVSESNRNPGNVPETQTSTHNSRRPLVSYADVLNSSKQSKTSQENGSNSNNMPTTEECDTSNIDNSQLENMLLQIIRSFLPQIKSILLNILSTLINNGK